MIFDLWAIDGPFSLTPPIRPMGYLLFGLLLVFILALTVPAILRRERARQPMQPGEAGLLAALIFIAPLAQLLIRIEFPVRIALPGLPLEPITPGFSLLGSIPWMVAAGMMGAPQAALVAFAGGLANGGWVTNSLITPLSLAFQASLVASLLKLPYRERLARVMRQPLVAALVGAIAFAGVRLLARFAQSGGSLFDGLDFVLALLPPVFLGALIEGAIAGLAGSVLKQSRPADWQQPESLRTAPYNRSLAARMLAAVVGLGLLSLLALAGGQWVLARGAVRDLVAQNMRQRTVQAGDAIPFFIQTGRQSIQTLAERLVDGPPQAEDSAAWLEARSQAQTYFSTVVYFDQNGQAQSSYPPRAVPSAQTAAVQAVLPITLQGVPQEVIAPANAQEQGALFIYLAPVRSAQDGQVIGAVAGWTSLAQHPLLNPVVSLIGSAPNGETFLVDDRGQILLHPDPDLVLTELQLPAQDVDQVQLAQAPDGTRRLEYWYSVPGYSWRVVSLVPQRVVDRLALPIAARLAAVLGLVGVIFIAFVYWSSQRITRPLRQMTVVARAIAAGDLDRPVQAEGDDEVGKLAASFEQMRLGLKARLSQMDLLLNVSQTFAAELHIEDSLPEVLDGLRDLTGAEVARIALTEAASNWVADEALLVTGSSARWKMLDAQIRRLAQSRGAFMLDNPTRARAVLDLTGLDEPPGALMAAPVQEEDRYLGALWLGRSSRQSFEESDQRLLNIVAAQLGLWLANVNLYQQAEEERERLAALLEVTPDAVIAVGPDGRLLLANQAAEPFLSLPRQEVVGIPVEQAITEQTVQQLLVGQAIQEQTEEIALENGQVWSALAREIWAGGWRSVGRVCVLWDISHFRKLDMLKSEFVATVSHDLRAPLTLMRGYGTMISMVGALNEQQKEFITKILDSIDSMSQLVENLLDLGRIDAGLGLELETVHLPELIDDVLETYRPSAVNKQIAIEVDLPAVMEPLKADPTLLRQAIANLVDNAIKFTQTGGTVSLKAQASDHEVTFQVKDTGVGIAPADQSRLFERFYRARRQESLKARGSGLGLAIVKSIVEQHGGRVWVESKLGSGSTFTMVVPLDASIVNDASMLE